ncbi:MAG: mechanosensitive ion channel family protein [Deltaproteobacteria bacterium]|nr:mechanosensitive ion channel family protein [Deltaproteobacteria bacterium]
MSTLKSLLDKIVPALLSTWQDVYPILLKALLIVLGALIFWSVFNRVLKKVQKNLQKYEFVRTHVEIFFLIRKAVGYTLVLVCGIYLMDLFRIPILENVFLAVLVMLVAMPVKDFTMLALRYLEDLVAKRTESKVDDIVFDLLNKFAGVIIYVVAGLLALDMIGVNVVPFVAGAGVAGIAVGFAAKDTLSNLIAGVLLIIDRPFEVGDRIEVWSAPKNSATWGDVVDIGLRATKIKTTDNIIIIIPNNQIMTRDIINYTTISEDIRVRILIGVSYKTDLEQARRVILEVAKEPPWVAEKPPPVVVVKAFGESSVDLELRVWIKDARKRIHTISYLTDRVKAAFDKEGIEIPFPQRDIHILNDRNPEEPGKSLAQ